MSDDFDFNVRERARKQRRTKESSHESHGPWNGTNGHSRGANGWTRVVNTDDSAREEAIGEEPRPKRIDLWRLLDALIKRSPWLMAGTVLLAVMGVAVGLLFGRYTVDVPLIRQETYNQSGGATDATPSRELSPQTLLDLMRSPDILRRVSRKATPPIEPQELAKAVSIFPGRNPDFINVRLSSTGHKRFLADWANLYADEVVAYTKEIQVKEARAFSDYLGQRLDLIVAELDKVNQKLARFSQDANVLDFEREVEGYLSQLYTVDTKRGSIQTEKDALDFKIRALETELARQNPVNDRLQTAKDELAAMLLEKREAHPDVIAQRKKVEALEKQSALSAESGNSTATPKGNNSLGNAMYLQIVEMKSQKEAYQKQLTELETWREKIQTRAKLLSSKTGEFASIKAQRQNLEIQRAQYANRQQEAKLTESNAPGYFRVYAKASPQDVSARKRWMILCGMAVMGAFAGMFVSAGLVLATEALDTRIKTVGDLGRVTRLPVLATLGDLQKMSPMDQVNWAFRTLTLLQGRLQRSPEQALVCGFISSKHGEGRSTWINLLVSAASQRGLRVLTVATRPANSSDDLPQVTTKNPSLLPVGPTTTLNNNVLAAPAQVMDQFSDPDAQPIVHIPLPGWVWNLERRKQWHSAVAQWREIQNLVLFIELPPACEPEAVLLAENLPQVIWLANSGTAREDETKMQLETLGHARCRLVGAVLNREQPSFWRKSFSRWFSALAIGASLFGTAVQAAEADQNGATNAPVAFLSTSSTNRAPWQQRLTLGPGDVLDLSLYKHPEFTKTNIVIGPDGRLSFLQAQSVPASDLTVDELRTKFDQELGKYYTSPRTIIVPVSFNSKKYYMLGKVMSRGVFTLDRPLTVLEAVARARGLETGFIERNSVEAADLSHSFLVRAGKRLPINFEKLFQQGDFSQNILIEPGDYFYFAPASFQEVYVLGEVLNPGPAMFSAGTSVIAALSSRGGFTPRAYKSKVAVIRGSFEKPDAFIVDVAGVLAGKTPDVKLQPKDIIYVNARPWIKLEELLDAAGQAFVEAAITSWTGANVGPVITHPVLPNL